MIKAIRLATLFGVGVALAIGPSQAASFFMVDPNPGAEKFFIDVANKDVSHFTGKVGDNNVGPGVGVDTVGNVDTGSGYANIKPIKDGTLTSLIFTPDNPDLFGDFSTRGQLEDAGGGTVTITVQDDQGHAPEAFVFNGLGSNADFDRIGIVAALAGETIKWVKVESNFKEFKQTDFSFAVGPGGHQDGEVPEPTTWALLILGFAGLATGLRRHRAAA